MPLSWQRLLLINYLSLNHMEARKILPKEPYSVHLGEDFYFSEKVNKKWIDVVFDHEKNNINPLFIYLFRKIKILSQVHTVWFLW